MYNNNESKTITSTCVMMTFPNYANDAAANRKSYLREKWSKSQKPKANKKKAKNENKNRNQ